MKEKFLPIGTILTLKGATKKVMVIGYLPISQNNVMFDYSACIFPEGVLDMNKTLAFNHDKIENIDFMGNKNEEFEKFNKNLINIRDTFTKIKNINV